MPNTIFFLKNCQKLLIFRQIGEISPNLVSLIGVNARGPYPFNDGGVADCQAVEEVHQDDDDEEHEGQEEQVTEHGANFALLKRVELT